MKNKGLKLLLLATALLFTGCGNNSSSSLDNSSELTSSELSSEVSSEVTSESSSESNYENLVSIAEALDLAKNAGSAGTSTKYTVIGKIVSIESAQYGDMTISDGTNELFIYGPRAADGETYFDKMEETPKVGDTVVLYGELKDYKGTLEMDHPAILSFEKGEGNEDEFDASEYTAKTVSEARSAAEGTKVKVTGVVAGITKAFGYANDGFYLVDNGNSIYVYGTDSASGVKVGNTVTVCGTKDYYVSDSESSSASKYGYKGCNQISSSYVIENDNLTTGQWDKTWIEEKTVKEIMDTPATEDITTSIFKVTGLVNKVLPESNDFVNYYINDLDGTTGSYVYTKNSGGDFAWLDAYDGKICDIYLSVINAKSSSSGCLWRFFPVAVEENTSFAFDMANATQFTWDYYLDGEIASNYSAGVDADVTLTNSVSNDILNFDATITYASSNEEVVYFTTENNVTKLHTGVVGNTTITVTINIDGQPALNKTIEVEVAEKQLYDCITVAEAIASSNETEVQVQGIVVSSLVNQKGFYLQDETGIIAVTGAASDVEALRVGDEVVVKGIKGEKHKSTPCTKPGQINIYNATIVENFHGNNAYSTSNFITGKTVADLYALTMDANYTASVYVVRGMFKVEELVNGSYTTKIAKLYNEDGTASISLYSSSAQQYSQFNVIDGQVGTFEVAITNWNCKNYYTGCIISAQVDGADKIINTLNFSA